MTEITLSDTEIYFLILQLEKIKKENPTNYIAKELFDKMIQYTPKVDSRKTEFQREYNCVWIGGERT